VLGLKDPFLAKDEATVNRSMMLAPLTSSTHPLMNTMMMKVEVLKEEGIQEMTFVTSTLKHLSLMAISNRKIILSKCEPLKG